MAKEPAEPEREGGALMSSGEFQKLPWFLYFLIGAFAGAIVGMLVLWGVL